MKISNEGGGNIIINNNGGIVGDGSSMQPPPPPPGLPVVWRTRVRPVFGLTYRHLMAGGGVGFLGLAFNTGSTVLNVFGSAASIEATYGMPWIFFASMLLLMVGFIGFLLRRNKVLQLPLLTLERGTSGKIYTTRYEGQCGKCGGRLHHLRFASNDFGTYFECENNSLDHRGRLDLSTLPDIEETPEA